MSASSTMPSSQPTTTTMTSTTTTTTKTTRRTMRNIPDDIKVVKDRWSDLSTYRKGFKKDEALNDTLHRVSGQTEGAGKVSTLTTNHGAEIGLHKGVLGSRGCRKGWMQVAEEFCILREIEKILCGGGDAAGDSTDR
ncbi:hypothetical protein HZH68_002197 [Vespula germanica]|uniref:Uncharacterized protein n=1 Tax=Vespula germanica TaxID=30212 RepID=A0A834KVM5_VESGE|nr:hypothetical protein HZH68_002197 [Vespula germanica]